MSENQEDCGQAIEPLKKSKAQWRDLLSDDAYRVLFQDGTERSGTSPLNHENRTGTFVCAACKLPLYTSDMKYESGTGWPSFFDTVGEDVVEIRTDSSHGMVREEAVCANCGAHLGHRFPDGPGPSGQRYCMNSASLRLDRDGTVTEDGS